MHGRLLFGAELDATHLLLELEVFVEGVQLKNRELLLVEMAKALCLGLGEHGVRAGLASCENTVTKLQRKVNAHLRK